MAEDNNEPTNADEPAPASTAAVKPLENGGVEAAVLIPTYDGFKRLAITAERDVDDDWHVTIPWPDLSDETDGRIATIDGLEFTNGVAYLGAPERSGSGPRLLSSTVERLVAAAEYAGVSGEDLDGVIHDLASTTASAVNNEGLAGQVGFLIEHLGAKGATSQIRVLAHTRP